MTLPRYPAYKDSGVPWLGFVPTHWNVLPLKRCATVQTGIAKGKDNEGKDTVAVSYLRVANVQDGHLRLDDVAVIDVPLEALARYQLQLGDVLMNEGGDADKLGRGCIWRGEIAECIHQNHVFAVRPYAVSSEWLNWVTGSAYAQFYFMSRSKQSTNLASISSTNIMDLPLVLAPPAEQTTVVAFLDRETAKIDALIAEQEKLIALLAEKRQATISHAVTRGLNSNAPMKDSGVPWLGEVPAHWAVRPLKHLARIGNGSTPNRDNPAYWADAGFPWLNSSVVNQEEVTDAQQFVTPLALQQCHLPIVAPPAVLVGITGQGKTRGMATQLAFTATVNQHLAYIKPRNELDVSYLLRVLEAAYEHLRTESEGAGSTKGAITCDQLARLRIPAPEMQEQEAIAAFLEQEMRTLETLTADSLSAINLLKERRSALIAAAVTGQIDVRGVRHHEPALV